MRQPSGWQRSLMAVAGAAVSLAAGGAGAAAGHPASAEVRSTQGPRHQDGPPWQLFPPAGGVNPSVAAWSPAYTMSPALPDFDAATALAFDGNDLWLSSEGFVAQFAQGVWQPPRVPPNVGAVFAVAAAGGEAWAFGFEGGTWHMTAGGWSDVPPVTGADLYAAAAQAPDDVWAVGFDFGSEFGTVVHYDGRDVTATIKDWLFRQQLFAVAFAPDGQVWAGGCDYASQPFLMAKAPGSDWAAVEVPPVRGCITDLSFSDSGGGLAAAGGDVLIWQEEGWSAAGIPAPEGKDWVRVAATVPAASAVATAQGQLDSEASAQPAPGDGAPGQPTVGWALAAVPSWPTYVSAADPLYYDGAAWHSPVVDYLGAAKLFEPSDVNPEPKPYVALASDGTTAWAVSRVATADALRSASLPEGSAALLELSDGRIQFAHPVLTQVEVIAAPDPADLWVGGRGAHGLLYRNRSWQMAGGRDTAYTGRLDFARRDLGWSLGVRSPSHGITVAMDTAWYWNGRTWEPQDLPGDAPVREIRTLPDGRGWGLTRDGTILERWPGGDWQPLPGAPAVARAPDLPGPGAPFDTVGSAGEIVGWVAAAEGFYRYEAGAFRRAPQRSHFQVADLQLVDPRHGWAIGYDLNAAPARRSRLLLRLTDRRWEAVPPIGASARFVDWQQMSAVNADEVWLLGNLRSDRGAVRPILARFDGRWRLFGAMEALDAPRIRIPGCSAKRLAAVGRRDGATDVWLGGTEGPCGPTEGPAPEGPYAGPVSHLYVAPVRGRALLPMARR